MLGFQRVRQAMQKAREKKNEFLDRRMLSNMEKLEKAQKLHKEMETRQFVKQQLQEERKKISGIRTAPIRKAAKGVKGFMKQARARAKKNQSNMFGTSKSAFELGSSGGGSPFAQGSGAGSPSTYSGRNLQKSHRGPV